MGAGREKVHRWWHTKQLADSRIIMGKPSVLFRKVVNTRVGDEIVAVNAQQYAVLVMDVPDLHKESAKCASPALQPPTRQYMPSCLSHAYRTDGLSRAEVSGSGVKFENGHAPGISIAQCARSCMCAG